MHSQRQRLQHWETCMQRREALLMVHAARIGGTIAGMHVSNVSAHAQRTEEAT